MKTIIVFLMIGAFLLPAPAMASHRNDPDKVEVASKQEVRKYERAYRTLTKQIKKLERQRDREIRSYRSGGTVSGAKYASDSIYRKYATEIAKLWKKRAALKKP